MHMTAYQVHVLLRQTNFTVCIMQGGHFITMSQVCHVTMDVWQGLQLVPSVLIVVSEFVTRIKF